jgi:hypothetical protein
MNILLVPAHAENIATTISRGIPVSATKPHLNPDEIVTLERGDGSGGKLYCWAMNSGSSSLYPQMRFGDIVLITIHKTGLFKYYANVGFKTKSGKRSSIYSRDESEDPSENIYILNEITAIDIPKSILLEALDYDPTDHVSGVRCVTFPHLRRVNEYPTVLDFIKSLKAGKVDLKPRDEYQANIDLDQLHTVTIPAGGRIDLDQIIEEPTHPYVRPPFLIKTIELLEEFKRNPQLSDRSYETVVESFYESLGYIKQKIIRFREGRIEIYIYSDGKAFIVNEVIKDWGLSQMDHQARAQGYLYALEHDIQHVVVTNGDYYGIYDRHQRSSFGSNYLGEFHLSRLKEEDLALVEILRK